MSTTRGVHHASLFGQWLSCIKGWNVDGAINDSTTTPFVSVTFQERFQGSKSHSNTNQDSAKCSQASNHLRSLYLFEKASATCRKRLFMLFCRILEQLATAVSKFQTNTKMPRNCVEAQTGEHHHQNLPY